MGAVTPSGKILARTMASFVDPRIPGPVIELGPGTGPVTDALIRRGVAQDRLVLIEYNPEFCQLLKRRFPKKQQERILAVSLDNKALETLPVHEYVDLYVI